MSATRSSGQKTNVRDLALEEVVPNPQNPRLIFPISELEVLAESIDQEGILVPITVYPKDGKFVLVDGERRYRCALDLGLPTIPALITTERTDRELLEQMFNIHLIREQWQDMPTAWALQNLAVEITRETKREPNDAELSQRTGLSSERVRRLRYVVTLPTDWQDYIATGTIPLNFFWELKQSVIEPLAKLRPDLSAELDPEKVMESFVDKRLRGLVKDTISLRKVTPIIRYSADAQTESGEISLELDESIRSLVQDQDTTIEDVYEDTVQIMVEADKLERRTVSMIAAFRRLIAISATDEERNRIKIIGSDLARQIMDLIEAEPNEVE